MDYPISDITLAYMGMQRQAIMQGRKRFRLAMLFAVIGFVISAVTRGPDASSPVTLTFKFGVTVFLLAFLVMLYEFFYNKAGDGLPEVLRIIEVQGPELGLVNPAMIARLKNG